MNHLLEICAGNLASALNARAGGANRIELCDNLNEGGTTPSPGVIIQAVKLLDIPVFILVRPRPGDFLYSDEEFEAMKEDVLFCKERGAKGVVLGVLKADSSVDIERTGELVALARPMQVTFHRAFDRVKDPFSAMEDIISLGIERILTSGQATSALAGAELIEKLNNRANNRIIIMPGSGINENNVSELISRTGAREVHASLRSPVKSMMQYLSQLTDGEKVTHPDMECEETNPKRVKEVCKKLKSIN